MFSSPKSERKSTDTMISFDNELYAGKTIHTQTGSFCAQTPNQIESVAPAVKLLSKKMRGVRYYCH